jgi:hypothetical protein
MTLIAIAALACIGVRSAAALTIADLIANPKAYNDTLVTVVGDVELSVPVGSESTFDLRDGPAKITVISRSAAPAVGARLAVTGTAHLVSEGGHDVESTELPPVIIESARAPAP